MSDHLPSDELARRIAHAIFVAGECNGQKAHRIEFKGGTWPDHETNLGGLCEKALAELIAKNL
jgi:hypothetical protein